MSRIDDLLERSADEVRQAVAEMPDREGTTVAQTSTRKTYLSAAVAVAGVIAVVLLGWALFGFGPDEVDPIQPPPTSVDPSQPTTTSVDPDAAPPPSSALDLEGDTELLAEQARAAADEVGDPELEAAIEDAIDSGLLDFSGTPEEAIVNLQEFIWLLDTTNPEPEMLDLFLAPDGRAREAWERSDTFGAGGLIIVTGEGDFQVEDAAASPVADYSPSIAATSPDDAVVAEVVISIPEIEFRDAAGGLVRVAAERPSEPYTYILVPSETGWLIWSELV